MKYTSADALSNSSNCSELDTNAKNKLRETLLLPCHIDGKCCSLQEGITFLVTSLRTCYSTASVTSLVLPDMIFMKSHWVREIFWNK